MKIIKLCEAAEVNTGEMVSISVGGLPPLAVYNVDGTYYVTSNICTHAVATLTDGYLEGDVVECPLHGGAFNVRNGEAARFPCVEALQTFEVEVREGVVFVKVQEAGSSSKSAAGCGMTDGAH